MIDRILFSGTKLQVLKTALDAYAQRGKVHAANIANAETPGYRAREVEFENDLALALRSADQGRLETTQARHLSPAGQLPRGEVTYRNPPSAYLENGVNDVQIDREMADLAANTMRFNVAAELVSRAYRGMKSAIRGRPGMA